jgi:hypothetical protein
LVGLCGVHFHFDLSVDVADFFVELFKLFVDLAKLLKEGKLTAASLVLITVTNESISLIKS